VGGLRGGVLGSYTAGKRIGGPEPDNEKKRYDPPSEAGLQHKKTHDLQRGTIPQALLYYSGTATRKSAIGKKYLNKL